MPGTPAGLLTVLKAWSRLMKIHRFTEKTQTKPRLGRLVVFALAAALLPASLLARTVVFWQPGFPTVASQPIERSSLLQALDGMDSQFADVGALNAPATLSEADLLILPYGSAVPANAWKAIEDYLHEGGNLLVVGGQPLRVPVTEADGKFLASAPQDTYSRFPAMPISRGGPDTICPRLRRSAHADSSLSKAGWTGSDTWWMAQGCWLPPL
jgi:hypothetical protein